MSREIPKCELCGAEYWVNSPNYGWGSSWAHYCKTGRKETFTDMDGPDKAESYRMAGVEPPRGARG